MLIVEEAPENSHEEVENGDPSIEGELGYLGTRQLAICIAEFYHSLVVARSILVCEDAVVTSVFDVIFNRLRVLEVNGLGENQVLGLLCRIRRQDKLSNVGLVAESGLDILLFTDTSFLCTELDYPVLPLLRLFHT